MIKTLIFCLMASIAALSNASSYLPADSAKVVALLNKASSLPEGTNRMIWFARQLKNIPYVAHTLEVNKEEQLIVNLRQLDCTTYVENVLALTICDKKEKRTFRDFVKTLQDIRYRDGEINDYSSRLHYFTDWIENNTKMGFVREKQGPEPPFTKTQTINVYYMTAHPHFYTMLKGKTSLIEKIRQQEKAMNGKTYKYIPKGEIANNQTFRNTISDGDIIAITTSKKGLDTSHIGIAVWHNDGLHMLNASQIHKKVVEEPMTLYEYMHKHPSQTGIRIIGVNK